MKKVTTLLILSTALLLGCQQEERPTCKVIGKPIYSVNDQAFMDIDTTGVLPFGAAEHHHMRSVLEGYKKDGWNLKDVTVMIPVENCGR